MRETHTACRKLLLAGLAVMLAAAMLFAPSAGAQDDRYETCAAYGTMVGTGGTGAVAAAERLKDLAAPNPPGIDQALDVVIDAEDATGTTPDTNEIFAAYDTLDGYYGDLCRGIDICPLVRQAVATNDGSSADAARLVRGLTAPAPPGIDAALALIAGDVTESPFHNSVGEAQAQVSDWFMCDELAFTGPSQAVVLTTAGLVMVAVGAVARRLSTLTVSAD